MNEHCSKKAECFAFLGIVGPPVDLSLYLAMAGNARYNWDRVAKKVADSEINFAMLPRLGACALTSD
jgi:hypothetical protein